jgi:coenzyme F420-0:L-glutamate ligase/coenzyme F420-1:gamma-L-glutamate ligase
LTRGAKRLAIEVIPIEGVPEVSKGDDLGSIIARALARQGTSLKDNDIVVVKQKVVSKSEGRVIELADVLPGRRAKSLAKKERKDPRLVQLILKESVRVVRTGHGVIITETKQGFVCANSGVDQSNVGGGKAALLPVDPDKSARRLRKTLEGEASKSIAVIISDTFGRPWRRGQTDVAIGCSGIEPLLRYAGKRDKFGYALRVTEPSVADEVAGAAELAIGKLSGIAAAVVRGVKYTRGDSGIRSVILPRSLDLFR